jgi:colanic acid biosynthesis glycosyl transferase WcaI
VSNGDYLFFLDSDDYFNDDLILCCIQAIKSILNITKKDLFEMKILIYGLNYYPELTGVGKYTGEMSEYLALRGHDVRVITSSPHYPDWKVSNEYKAYRYYFEKINNVEVWRAPLWLPHNINGLKRLICLSSFSVSSFPLLLTTLFWRPQIVIVIAPSLLYAAQALLVSKLSGSKSWIHVQDFEVDAAFGLGILPKGLLYSIALRVERWLFSHFDQASSISKGMTTLLVNKGVSPSKVVHFPNWIDVNEIFPIYDKSSINFYRKQLSIKNNVVVALYSGNMGKKQGLEILYKSAQLTKKYDNLVWVFCGDGVGRIDLEKKCSNLPNVIMLTLQPKEKLNKLLNLADIHLLPQSANVAGLVLPSKLIGILSSGRPVVATSFPNTELYDICRQFGIVVDPGDEQGFSKAVLLLANDTSLRNSLGRKSRKYAINHLGMKGILDRLNLDVKQLNN